MQRFFRLRKELLSSRLQCNYLEKNLDPMIQLFSTTVALFANRNHVDVELQSAMLTEHRPFLIPSLIIFSYILKTKYIFELGG